MLESIDLQQKKSGWRDSFRVFGQREFTLLWVAALISNCGTWIQVVSESWLVWELSHSPLLVGVLNFAAFAPAVVLTIPAGVLADRLPRRRLLLVGQVGQMLIASYTAFVVWHGTTATVLIVVAFLMGTINALSGPSWMAMFPSLVAKEDLSAAVAMNSTQFNLARLIGPAIGGALLVAYGASVAYGLNAVSYIAVVAALIAIRTHATERAAAAGASTGFREAWTFARQHAGIRRVLVSVAVFTLLGGPVQGLLSVMAEKVLGTDASGFSILLACFGGGAVVAAGLIGAITKRMPRHHLIPAATTGFGLAMIGFAESPLFGLSAVLVALAGMGWFLVLVSSTTAIQLLAPESMRGRILAIYGLSWAGTLPIGNLLGGLIGEHLSTPLALTIFGVLLTAFGLYTTANREPAIDGPVADDEACRPGGLIEGFTARSHRSDPQTHRSLT